MQENIQDAQIIEDNSSSIETLQQNAEMQERIEKWKHDYRVAHTPVQRVLSKKIGRNDPCPCGSGKKYKKCCYSIGEKNLYKEIE